MNVPLGSIFMHQTRWDNSEHVYSQAIYLRSEWVLSFYISCDSMGKLSSFLHLQQEFISYTAFSLNLGLFHGWGKKKNQ